MFKQVMKKLPFWQRNVNVEPLSQDNIDQKYRSRCYRGKRFPRRDTTGKVIEGTERIEGKTAKDHRTGAWNQRFTRVSSDLPSRKQHRGDVPD